MKHCGRLSVAALAVIAGLALGACADTAAQEEGESGAATVTEIDGSEVSRVTLTKDAAKRLDIQTAAVSAAKPGKGTRIPYAAVLYDPNGDTWAFVNRKPLTYVRESITVDRIDGDVAFLTDGPTAGTKVVRVGASELYGSEIGVGDE